MILHCVHPCPLSVAFPLSPVQFNNSEMTFFRWTIALCLVAVMLVSPGAAVACDEAICRSKCEAATTDMTCYTAADDCDADVNYLCGCGWNSPNCRSTSDLIGDAVGSLVAAGTGLAVGLLIVIIVVPAVITILIIACIIYCCCCKKKEVVVVHQQQQVA